MLILVSGGNSGGQMHGSFGGRDAVIFVVGPTLAIDFIKILCLSTLEVDST